MDGLRETRPEEAGFFYMDVLRLVAAALVVLNHVRDLVLVDAAQGAPSAAAKLLYFSAGFGHQSVMVFFVLSGFWITGATLRRDRWPIFWRDFMIDRLSRLMVVVVPALVIGGLLDWIGWRIVAPGFYAGESGAHSMANVAVTLTPWAFAGHLVFLQSLATTTFGSNGPLWSLAYEFWYYVWFPALWLLAVRWRWSVALAALALGVAYPSLAYGFLSWLSGTALFFALQACVRRRWLGRRGIAGALLMAGGGALATLLVYARLRGSPWWTDLPVSMAFAVFLLGLCLWVPRRLNALDAAARYGAEASFSLYAIHYPLIAFVVAIGLGGVRIMPTVGGCLLVGGLWLAVITVAPAFAWATERRTGVVRNRLRGWFMPAAGATPPARQTPA